MRIARRSHLSRIASDDDWFTEPWWEDGAEDQDPERRQPHHLHGPRIAHPTPQGKEELPSRGGPFIDPSLAKGSKETGGGRRRKGRR